MEGVVKQAKFASVLGAAILALGVGTAAPADAEDVALDGTALTVTAAPGEDNVVSVEPDGLSGYSVFDDGAYITPGSGCFSLRQRAVFCQGLVLSVVVDAGDRDDIVAADLESIPVTLSGGAGRDLLEGGASSDTLSGGLGQDTVLGGGGDDTLAGDEGGDWIEGGAGADDMRGGSGYDVLDGGSGDGDVVAGGPGADLASGGLGDDTVQGGFGEDAIAAGGGTDSLMPGRGHDEIYLPVTSSSEVHCRPGDRVRALEAVIPPGCERLSVERRFPTVWPPRRAQAALAPNPGPPKVRLLRRGHTREVDVIVPRPDTRDARVKLVPRDRHHHRLRRVSLVVHGRDWVAFRAPPPSSRTFSVTIRCCF
jgi:hypothetical protein